MTSMSIFSKLFVNFAAEFLTAYVIISVYWSSPVFIQLAFVVICKVAENQRLDQLFIVKNT